MNNILVNKDNNILIVMEDDTECRIFLTDGKFSITRYKKGCYQVATDHDFDDQKEIRIIKFEDYINR